MANQKISALTAATTPLAGTEVLPIVQSGATVKVAVSDLTAGRAISATQITLTTGNVIVANGQGIDFSATPGTGTSELFNDYEEGSFTATLTPLTSGTITLKGAENTLTYTKVGRLITICGAIAVNSVSLPVGAAVNMNLPSTAANLSNIGSSWLFVDSPAFSVTLKAVEVSKNTAVATLFVTATDVSADDKFEFSFSYVSA